MNDNLVDYVKTLELKPGTILVVDVDNVDTRRLANIRLAVDFPVPIMAVIGTPSIKRFTRAELVEALRLIDQVSGGSAGASASAGCDDPPRAPLKSE